MRQESSQGNPHQLQFIDGLRALAALYIVLHHAVQGVSISYWWLSPFRYGAEAVIVFIVISGFCLGLPLARREEWKLKVGSFYWRRIRRILPPYYAALAIGFATIALSGLRGRAQDYAGVSFSWPMVWSHVGLIQNWMPTQVGTVDGPLWSVAVEFQIYLLFPILVFLRRRTGRLLALFLWFVFAQILAILARHGGYVNLLFLFGIGVWGVDLAFTPKARRWLLPGFFISCLCLFLTFGRHMLVAQCFIASGTAFSMAYLTQVPTGFGNKTLSWPPLAWVGTFSYSLYLVHSYMQVGAARWLSKTAIWNASSVLGQAGLILLITPLILGVSYGFHVIFERPFMRSARQRTERDLLEKARKSPQVSTD